ncbi:type IV pilin protein [Marinagarivorans algicola]|uniref:type IV pilin protein n=1 Tax=Marinagarivorans algicola TaxID=1513270 RepID=UPI0006B97244|nr:type IV pilin protein [Marinagarivorans algicola]
MKKNRQGFTLIELMIVVAIVGILAAVAIPSYQQYIEKSRRVDAKETLMRLATLQERFFFQRSSYTNDLTELGVAGTPALSPEGWYQIAMTHTPGCTGTGTSLSCSAFTITATAIGAQANDTRCTSFSIDHALRQTATGTDAVNCW